MPQHDCETYDFPVANGTINYRVRKKIIKALGGTGIQAVRDALEEAREKARQDGEAAMQNETCAKPCDRLIYVEPTIDTITATYAPGKKDQLVVVITGIWKAGILCIKRPASTGSQKKTSAKKRRAVQRV